MQKSFVIKIPLLAPLKVVPENPWDQRVGATLAQKQKCCSSMWFELCSSTFTHNRIFSHAFYNYIPPTPQIDYFPEEIFSFIVFHTFFMLKSEVLASHVLCVSAQMCTGHLLESSQQIPLCAFLLLFPKDRKSQQEVSRRPQLWKLLLFTDSFTRGKLKRDLTRRDLCSDHYCHYYVTTCLWLLFQ